MVPWGYLYFIRRAFLAFVVATAGYAGQAEFICKRLAARLDPAFAKHAQQLLVDAEANLRKQENGVEGGRLPRDGWEARRIGLLELYRQLHNLAQVHEANEKVMREDPAYEEMAKGENAEIERTVRKLSGDIKKQVLETLDPGPGANAPLIIEVNADGKGYDAGMFVKYLTQTYAATAKANGLKIDVVSTQLGETQASGTGYTSATLMVSGKDAYRIFRSEAGVHVMKSPPLDGKKDNRIFTTPIRVTVVPEISTKSAESIPESEFEIQPTRASGPGGQNVNKVESAIRVTHRPTGIVVFIQNERDQIRNKETALKICRSRVAERYNEGQRADAVAAKRAQMGSGATGERVRTYYLPTDEVVDNRTGTRLSWSEFQEGQVPQGYRDALDDDRLLELTAVAPTTTFFLPEVPSRR